MTTIRLGAPVGSAAGGTIQLGAPWGAGAQPATIRLGAPFGGGPEQTIGSGPFLVVDPRDPSRTVPARLYVYLPDGVIP